MIGLYFCDNGRVYCGAHLGHSARTTGRDISGQAIMPVRASDLDAGERIECEHPGCAAAVEERRAA